MPDASLRIGVVLFEGFELLDVFGPLEMFGVAKGKFEITLIGPHTDPLASSQGPRSVCDFSYDDAPAADIVLVPGGIGNRPLLADRQFLEWLARYSARADYVTSVCTGSALLAAAGLLDGYRATTNKRAFSWVREIGDGSRSSRRAASASCSPMLRRCCATSCSRHSRRAASTRRGSSHGASTAPSATATMS
jgi:putative intracellular protease/amidase